MQSSFSQTRENEERDGERHKYRERDRKQRERERERERETYSFLHAQILHNHGKTAKKSLCENYETREISQNTKFIATLCVNCTANRLHFNMFYNSYTYNYIKYIPIQIYTTMAY